MKPEDRRVLPELGACAHDVRFAAEMALTALGVTLSADDGKPTPETIMAHALTQACADLSTLIEVAPDGSVLQAALAGLHGRLTCAHEAAGILSKLYASGSAER